MKDLAAFRAVQKALADSSRVRALALLVHGELCLCELIQVLGLAPSTVSRHMSELHRAGLIARRKEGRWQFYRLAGRAAPAAVRAALRSLRDLAKSDDQLRADADTLGRVKEMGPEEVSACY